jgi:hypothetical protein
MLILLMVSHGLIHLVGLTQPVPLTPTLGRLALTAIDGPGSASAGVAWRALWSAACVALLLAAVMCALRQPYWWLVGSGAVVLSQCMIIFTWKDAKFGTIANVILAVVMAMAWADARFQREGDRLVSSLLQQSSSTPAPFSVVASDLVGLPAPVSRWLARAGVVGQPRVRSVRLHQRGELRTAPEQAFMPARAEQYFSVDPPAFVWRVKLRMFKTLPIVGRDSYLDGKGHMLIKAGSTVSVVDAEGPTIDQGTLLRYLGELIWFPSAALSSYVHWEPIDADRARVTMTYRGVSAAAEMTFDALGRMTQLHALRFMGGGPDAKLQPWHVTATEWRRFSGTEVPTRGDVTWQLASGAFTYYRWTITDLQYNVTE